MHAQLIEVNRLSYYPFRDFNPFPINPWWSCCINTMITHWLTLNYTPPYTSSNKEKKKKNSNSSIIFTNVLMSVSEQIWSSRRYTYSRQWQFEIATHFSCNLSLHWKPLQPLTEQWQHDMCQLQTKSIHNSLTNETQTVCSSTWPIHYYKPYIMSYIHHNSIPVQPLVYNIKPWDSTITINPIDSSFTHCPTQESV